MDHEMANTYKAEGNKIPSSDGDAESGMFENGILAGDLDSLLEMFEEAETALSSSVDCISLTRTDALTEKEGNAETSILVSQSSSHPDVSECAPSALNVSTVAENVTSVERGDGTCQASLSDGTAELDNPGGMPCLVNFVQQRSTTDMEGTKDKSSPNVIKHEDLHFDEDSLGLATFSDSIAESFSTASANVALGPWSPTSQDIKGGTWTRMDAGNNAPGIPGFSTGETFFQKYDSETSSEGDEDCPSEEKYSDSSSSPTSDSPYYRGRGSTMRRDGPRRQQGRGRVKSIEEEKLYDRLPSYYTVLSRPNRTPTGLIRSSRSCLKLILNSDLPSRDRDPSPDSKNQVFDKVPSYQSCFTNSTRYDEDSEIGVKFESGDACVDNEGPRSGRGHGSGSSYAHSRPRFRSRSRLRSLASPRHRRSLRSGRTANLNHTSSSSSLTTLTKINTAETRFSAQNRWFLATDLQSPEMELTQNKQKEQQRKIVYIGGIPATLTAERLKETFEQFGQIEKCTVHFRECGDNYGFVTYVQSSDACRAVEEGRRLQGCGRFDICFGGRRNFCRADYFDLDGNVEMEEELAPVIPRSKVTQDFDRLLMDELLKRKLQ